MEKILITGACGQVGSELTLTLRELYGNENVWATDISEPRTKLDGGPFEKLDVLDVDALEQMVDQYNITQIYHLAAMLSAKAEQNPGLAWKLNTEGLLNVLNTAREKALTKIFWPSSIAVFGPDTPADHTPQTTIMNPNTVYGISKLACERWCEYYYQHYDVDIRSLRYPGLIGYKSMPGGGTTDYAVEIFHKALDGEPYECFLAEDTSLPMMYMNDAIKATIDIMQADPDQIKIRSSYNIAAMSFSPQDLAKVIKEYVPEFEISYMPDYRQKIAESWPNSIDDRSAREDWNWQHEFNLNTMAEDLFAHLSETKSEKAT